MIARIGRIALRTLLGILIALIVFLLIFDRMVQFRMDDKDLLNWFHSRNLAPQISYFNTNGRSVRYMKIGESSEATVLFIHGAPSSLSYWKGYLSDSVLLSRATLYAVDRPGYGYSGLAEPLPEIAKQANVLRLIIDSLHKAHRPLVVVGVSYGGPIACRLVMDNPDLVDGLVLMAPPLGPGREKIFWFTYPVENPLIHWVVPRMLQTANTEKIHHKEELVKMLPLWDRIHVPVMYLQGMQDELVDTSNASFARQELKNAPSLDIQMIPGRGHLIAFAEKDRIERAILDMIDTCEKRSARIGH